MSSEIILTNIKYSNESIFNSKAQTIVNTVNTVGVMGKGIAKTFKSKYPKMFNQYKKMCLNKEIKIGKLFLYRQEINWILNFPTKEHWMQKSKIEFIEEGLQDFIDNYENWGITSISFPPLGTANGGLNWLDDVKPIMEKFLAKVNIPVTIHLYKPPETKTLANILYNHFKIDKNWKFTNKSRSFYFKHINFTVFWKPDSEELSITKKDQFAESKYQNVGKITLDEHFENNLNLLFKTNSLLQKETHNSTEISDFKDAIIERFNHIMTGILSNSESKSSLTKDNPNQPDIDLSKNILKTIFNRKNKIDITKFEDIYIINEVENEFKRILTKLSLNYWLKEFEVLLIERIKLKKFIIEISEKNLFFIILFTNNGDFVEIKSNKILIEKINKYFSSLIPYSEKNYAILLYQYDRFSFTLNKCLIKK